MTFCLSLTLTQTIFFLLLHTLQAPEELCSQTRSQQLELRFLRQLLQLHSATLQKIQKEAESLHASDQKGNQGNWSRVKILHLKYTGRSNVFGCLHTCCIWWRVYGFLLTTKLLFVYAMTLSSAVQSRGGRSEASEGSGTKSQRSHPTLRPRPALWGPSQNCHLLLVRHISEVDNLLYENGYM